MSLWLVALTNVIIDKQSSLCLLEGEGIWMYNLSCFKSARWEIVLLYKTAVVKQLSLGTKSQCYTMVLLSPTLSTYWKEKRETALSVIWLFFTIWHADQWSLMRYKVLVRINPMAWLHCLATILKHLWRACMTSGDTPQVNRTHRITPYFIEIVQICT